MAVVNDRPSIKSKLSINECLVFPSDTDTTRAGAYLIGKAACIDASPYIHPVSQGALVLIALLVLSAHAFDSMAKSTQ